MKNLLVALVLAAAVSLGAFSIYQHNQLTQLRSQLAAAENDLKSARDALKDREEAGANASLAEKKAKILQETLTEASVAAAKQSEHVSKLQQSLEAAKTNAENTGLAGLFKDPEMKEMIKAQQKMVLGPMVDKMYGDFLQQSGLTPEQAAQVRELVQKKMLVSADLGMSLLDGNMDAAKRTELVKQIKTETDAVDAQIKDLLGEDKYKEFQYSEKSASDRVVVGQFRDQLASTAGALNALQEKQLVTAMREETDAFKWTTSPGQFENPGDGDFARLLSDERINTYTAEKERLDAQVLDRARQILTPEQVTQFEQFQASQRQLQAAQMKMAAKLFGVKGP